MKKIYFILTLSLIFEACSSIKHNIPLYSDTQKDTLYKNILFVTPTTNNTIKQTPNSIKVVENPKITTTKKQRPSLVFSLEEQKDVRYTANFFEVNQNSRTIDFTTLKDEFYFPLNKYVVYSKYGQRNGRMHTGVDFSAAEGEPIRCLWPGVVRMAGTYGGYGEIIIVHHYNGLESVYAHLSKINVRSNQSVEAGELLGLVGKTGRATGSHLHLEIRAAGEHLDPLKLIDTQNRNIRDGVMTVHKRAGQSIIEFNSDNSSPVVIKETAPTSSEHNQYNKAKSSGVYHKVVKGDTLWNISKRYGTTVSNICSLNGIKSSDTLSLGQNLRIK